MVLKGPCKGPINFLLQGDLVAPTDEASNCVDHWITFQYIDQLTINGGGSFDGQGPSAWPYNNCDKDPNCSPLPIGDSGVKISDVQFSNIYGTTNTQIAVTLNCSKSNPCQNIEMRDINIAYNGGGGPAKPACANAYGASYGQEHPLSCLLA
ncbi:hypothetical protein LWI29_025326 [Acer saccharum]|uniref:Polygalacturonase n=1 Tax=Acer saccharum TaxID=4024 RepID=A0AA39T7K6_ACESA|nr:hypothetical protein LWI29_025326 [Acer saccharum]